MAVNYCDLLIHDIYSSVNEFELNCVSILIVAFYNDGKITALQRKILELALEYRRKDMTQSATTPSTLCVSVSNNE